MEDHDAWSMKTCVGCGKPIAVSDWNTKPVCSLHCLSQVDELFDSIERMPDA